MDFMRLVPSTLYKGKHLGKVSTLSDLTLLSCSELNTPFKSSILYIQLAKKPLLSESITIPQQTVRSIGDPDKESKSLDNWIESIAEIHRQKPPTTVHYTKYVCTISERSQICRRKQHSFSAYESWHYARVYVFSL